MLVTFIINIVVGVMTLCGSIPLIVLILCALFNAGVMLILLGITFVLLEQDSLLHLMEQMREYS